MVLDPLLMVVLHWNAAGAALEHDLNSAALNTYSATKIKKNA